MNGQTIYTRVLPIEMNAGVSCPVILAVYILCARVVMERVAIGELVGLSDLLVMLANWGPCP